VSKLARPLIVGAMLAAMSLAATTAVAHAQVTDKHDARRPPTQGQVGEAWHQPRFAADAPTVAGASTVAGDARQPQTDSRVGEPWRHQTGVPGRPAEPGGQAGWRMASLGFLAAALALSGGFAVLAATRPSRRPRAGPAP
jgi:hypothetical protein